tara:strand:- start:320 stop:1069 length:750 start_codon:yes stop_codon:yes gene_type:complete
MAKKKKNLADMVKAPRKIDINGQLHMLAWITADEGKALKLLGGAGKKGPMGIPSFYGPGGPGDDGTDPSGTDEGPGEGPGASGGPSEGDDPTGNTDGSTGGVGGSSSTDMGIDSSQSDMESIQAGLEAGGPADIGGNENDELEIKKAIQAVAEKIPDESPLTDAMKAYYGKGIGTSTIDMSTAAGRATSLANMTSPSTSAIGGKFDPATGRYIFPDGRIFDTATGKFLPISQSNKIEGLDLFRPIEGVK